MSEQLFPSGPWTGFYNYKPGDRHGMDIHLTFGNGLMSGDGRDDVGTFLIKGRYDSASGECHWTKSYLGAHDVYYRGFREGKGIWGTWEISIRDHGGFHIWPRSSGSLAASSSASDQSPVVDAIGIETANPKQEPIEIQSRDVNASTAMRKQLRCAPGTMAWILP